MAGIGQVSAGPITYDLVNYSAYQNGWVLNGSITTDGVSGALASSDITDWSVTLSMGDTSETFSSDQGGSSLYVDNVIATDTQIYLEPQSGANSAELTFIGPPYGGTEQIDWVQSTTGEIPYSYYAAELPDKGLTWQSFPPFGDTNFVIATSSVPEPTSIILLGIASMGMALVASRKKPLGWHPVQNGIF